MIDIAIPAMVAVAVIAVGTAVGVGGGIQELNDLGRDLAAERTSEWGALQVLAVLSLGLAWLWWIVGLAVSEWRHGRTPGKALMGSAS